MTHEIYISDIDGCARCGQNHDHLEFSRFRDPVQVGLGAKLTHWAPCPETGEPILMRIIDQPEEVSEAWTEFRWPG